MTDRDALVIEPLEAGAILAVDLWSNTEAAATRLAEALGGPLPEPNRGVGLPGAWRAIRIEPTVWWLIGPLAATASQAATLEMALAGDGGVAEISGAFATLRIKGPAWRELLMIGGVFDAESGAFGPGSTVGTILHHIGVRYVVVGEDEVHILTPPSYLHDLMHHLAIARRGIGEA